MNDEVEKKELILGCDCMSLDHIALFSHFPCCDEEGEKVAYASVKIINYFNEIFPPLSILNKNMWRFYFHYNFFNRVKIAISHIFNDCYERDNGIFDCFDFQNKDLLRFDGFLSLITDTNLPIVPINADTWIDNNKWSIKFHIDKFMEEMQPESSWYLGWNIQFKQKTFFGRIKDAVNYITGNHDSEQSFTIYPKDAFLIRSMIKCILDKNRKKEVDRLEGLSFTEEEKKAYILATSQGADCK